MFKFRFSILIFTLILTGAFVFLPLSPARADDAPVCPVPSSSSSSSSHSSDNDPGDHDHHSSHHKKTLPATGIPTGALVGGLFVTFSGVTLVRKGFISFRKRSV